MKTVHFDFEKPLLELEKKLEQLRVRAKKHPGDSEGEMARLERLIDEKKREIYDNLTPWQRVQTARHPKRPYTLDYVHSFCEDFIELHGDRRYGDDKAIVGGPATIEGRKIMVIGHQKGRDTREKLARNFGSAHPEGYRKALRLMWVADKFGLPILTLIDTPGAYPGIGAEERHIAEAIAVNLREMFNLRVPIVAVVIGEGGSGGALGIGVADRVLILENAYYSVISPEGCAAILWKDSAFAPQAASALRISAKDLFDMSLVDEVIPEPLGGAHHDPDTTFLNTKNAILKHFDALARIEPVELLRQRYDKFRAFGEVAEEKNGA